MRFKSIIPIYILIFFIILLSGCTDTSEQEVELSVLGVSGDSEDYTLSNLISLITVSGMSEYQNSYGNWGGVGTYKGVPISIFAEAVGGIQNGDILVVTSSDNYTQIFSYENIYPNTEQEAIQGTMILAYEFNGTRYPNWDDGLRIAFIPADGQYSNEDSFDTSSLDAKGAAGPKWVKCVKSLEFKREAEQVTFGTGSTNYTLSWTQILRLPSINQSGRNLNSINELSNEFYYTGINLTYVLDLIIDLDQDFSLEVVASDGYSRTFSKDQFYGNLTLYDESGTIIGHGGPENVSFILGYYEGDEIFGSGAQAFEIAFVGPETPITKSSYWVRDVIYINVVVT